MKTFLPILVLLTAAIATHAQTPVVPKSFSDAKQPQVAIDTNHNVFVTFGRAGAIYVTASTNSAISFNEPTLVAKLPHLALGMRRGPRITASDRDVAVTAISHDDGNLYCWVSHDHGRNWTKAIRVNDVPGAAREGLHAMAAQSNKVAAAWLDLRTGKTELRGSISSDDGATWSKNFLIYQSPDGHICECCHPSLAFGPDGKLFAMWRNWLNGSRDMYLAVSDDGGKTFSPAQKLGTGTWPIKACPMDGGGIAINREGIPVTVWRRQKNIIAASNDEAESRLSGDGSQPCITISASKTNIVWQSNDHLVFRGITKDVAFPKPPLGKYPSIASAGLATVLVWETGDTNSPIAAKVLP